MKKSVFYFLSLTWGLPMTLIGAIAVLILKLTGHEVKKWGYCYYVEVGRYWGGINLGMFFITSKGAGMATRNHEHGHALQNCYWGWLMPVVIGIPSLLRCWYLTFKVLTDLDYECDYDSIWFEGQATRWGTALVKNINGGCK